jgi:peptidoglycan/xylan/chitin deacetylase (PgdA/CDA1 family)
LHDFYDFLFELVSRLADRPVPFIGPWPRDSSWALVLTHDVEGEKGYGKLRELLHMELEAGYRSSWNFVPQNQYEVEDDLVHELREAGFEIGVHGLRHDGRDLASRATLRRRLPAIRSYAERWQAVGFRSPATLRSAELMPMLGFDYDSSYSDTAPFEPQPGGCCTWLPYMLDELVELPITLPQDHTLFEILGHRDEKIWLEKTRHLRARGGMALLITHPDYFDNPNLLESYRRFLGAFASDSSAWKALPREVSSWWRRRSESSLQEVNGEWRVVGPVEGEARVEFASAQLQAV